MFPQLHLETTLHVPGVNKQAVPGAMVRVSTQRRVTLATISARTRTPCGHSPVSGTRASRQRTQSLCRATLRLYGLWTIIISMCEVTGV